VALPWPRGTANDTQKRVDKKKDKLHENQDPAAFDDQVT
jgi:hypothetical protein